MWLHPQAFFTSQSSSLCVCMFLWYNLRASHFSLCFSALGRSSPYSRYAFVSPIQSRNSANVLTELQKRRGLLQCILDKHACILFHAFLPITPTPNRDSVKPKPQLCMNQNNNPQRFLLPSFPDTRCDSFFSGELHSRKSIEAHQLSRHAYMPRSNGGLPQQCLPARAYECSCLYQWGKLSWKTTEVNEDGWASLDPRSDVFLCYQLLNRLCCPAEDLRSVPSILQKYRKAFKTTRGIRFPHWLRSFEIH